jgi:hypothetical protein
MSKGGGKTQTVTQNNAPWSGAQPYINDVMAQGRNLYYGGSAPAFPSAPGVPAPSAVGVAGGTQGYADMLNGGANVFGAPAAAPTGVAGTPSTGISSQTNSLMNSIINQSQHDPLAAQAQSHLSKTLSGGFSNPFLSGAMGDAMDMARSKINSQFAGDNSGSSAHKEWLGRGITAAGLPFAQQSFENERARQMQAAGMAPGMAMPDLARLGTGLQVSQGRDQAPWDQLARYQQAISGYGGGNSTTQQPLHSTSAAQTIGTLGSLGMLGMMFSDVRLKTDIKKVGEQDGHNVYEFRYKGQPEKHVGVMAQEVLMKKPEAVHDIGGLLAVDYSKLGDK